MAEWNKDGKLYHIVSPNFNMAVWKRSFRNCWIVGCREAHLYEELKATDADAAKREAVALVRSRLEKVLAELPREGV